MGSSSCQQLTMAAGCHHALVGTAACADHAPETMLWSGCIRWLEHTRMRVSLQSLSIRRQPLFISTCFRQSLSCVRLLQLNCCGSSPHLEFLQEPSSLACRHHLPERSAPAATRNTPPPPSSPFLELRGCCFDGTQQQGAARRDNEPVCHLMLWQLTRFCPARCSRLLVADARALDAAAARLW